MTCKVIDRSCEEFNLDKIAEEMGYTGKRADVMCICGPLAVIIEETSGKAKREDIDKLLASIEFLRNVSILPSQVDQIVCILHHKRGADKGVYYNMEKVRRGGKCVPYSANCNNSLVAILQKVRELLR